MVLVFVQGRFRWPGCQCN